MPANQLQSSKTKSLIELLKNVGIFLRLKEKANADTYGKDFTVFTALGNEFDEKNTHSRFVYEIQNDVLVLMLSRLGTHSELFKK